MLNVNTDKHPHGINERRMARLKTEGGQSAVTASPHLTRERRVEVPVTPTSVNLTEGGSQAQSLPLTVTLKNLTLSIFQGF